MSQMCALSEQNNKNKFWLPHLVFVLGQELAKALGVY